MNAFYRRNAPPKKDGLSCTAFPSGVRGTPVEIAETCSPMIMLKKEYRAGSGGQGVQRWTWTKDRVCAYQRRVILCQKCLIESKTHPEEGTAGCRKIGKGIFKG